MKIDIKTYHIDGEVPDDFEDHLYEDEDEWADGMREFLEGRGYTYLGHSDTTDSDSFYHGMDLIEKGMDKGHFDFVTFQVDTDIQVFSKS